MRKLIIFVAIVSAITLAGFWGGRKACMLMWPGSMNPSQNWYFALGLNAEQAKSLEKLESSFRKDTDDHCMKICKERLGLLRLISHKGANGEVVNRKIEEIGTLQVLLEKQIAAHILEVKKDLTPEQADAYLGHIRAELHQSIIRSGYGEILGSETF